MNKNLSYEQYSQQFLTQLPKGAFLTVKEGYRLNNMNIGLCSIGYIWKKPILMVMVRYSRHTYDLIDKAPDFSVSLPLPGDLKKPLAIAGTKSGHDVDKFQAAEVTAQAARSIDSPVIQECGLIFECKTVFKQPMDPSQLDDVIRTSAYADDDFHVLYYGEIVACYEQ